MKHLKYLSNGKRRWPAPKERRLTMAAFMDVQLSRDSNVTTEEEVCPLDSSIESVL